MAMSREPIAKVARVLQGDVPRARLILGELKREETVLDPYLLIEHDGECVCLGIWETTGDCLRRVRPLAFRVSHARCSVPKCPLRARRFQCCPSGMRTSSPSSSCVIVIWHDSRESG